MEEYPTFGICLNEIYSTIQEMQNQGFAYGRKLGTDFNISFQDVDVMFGSFLASLCDAFLDRRFGRNFRQSSAKSAKAQK